MYWWNNEHKVAVIEISKNASSSFRENFRDWPSLHNTSLWKNSDEIEEIIVVFRDPYERFLSALNMFMKKQHWLSLPKVKNSHPKPIYGGDVPMRDIFPLFLPDTGTAVQPNGIFNIVDIHFELQSCAFHPRLYKKCPEKYTFFWMEGDIVSDVQTYLWNKYKITPPKYGRIHENRGGYNIIEKVNRTFVENTYKDDYEFFDKLTKEHKWENQ